MIRHLTLRNWRSYSELDLALPRGATFIVAPNGIGKSSIFEAARFAVFGVPPRRAGAHRLGGNGPTIAAVEIELSSGRVLQISRELGVKKKVLPPTVLIDGVPFDAAALEALLASEFGASVEFLDRVSMLEGSEVIGAAGADLDLRSHLSEFLGIGGVERALATTERLLKSAIEDVGRHRDAASISQAELDRLSSLAATAAAELSEAESVLADAQQRLQQARVESAAAARAAEHATRVRERAEGLHAAAAEAARLLGSPIVVDHLEELLVEAEAQARDSLDAIRRRRSELGGRIDAIASALDELTGTEGSCPVCRRPLELADVEAAREGHEEELEELRCERDALSEEKPRTLVTAIGDLRSVVLRYGPLPAGPITSVSTEEAAAGEANATAAVDSAVTFAANLRAEAMRARSDVASAVQATSALTAIVGAFERQASLEATRDALKAARQQLLDEGIEPLAEALGEHWTHLFDSRSGLELAGDGILSRAIGDSRLSANQFSDGERMAAQLLLRLLVLQATTRLPFLWIDEPLEHLDPDARRALSLLLASAPRSDGSQSLTQVVMTTYEEPLVRRLSGTVPGTHVRYVRAGRAPEEIPSRPDGPTGSSV